MWVQGAVSMVLLHFVLQVAQDSWLSFQPSEFIKGERMGWGTGSRMKRTGFQGKGGRFKVKDMWLMSGLKISGWIDGWGGAVWSLSVRTPFRRPRRPCWPCLTLPPNPISLRRAYRRILHTLCPHGWPTVRSCR